MNYNIDPDSQATQVRTHFKDILARHVTGESLQSIGETLPVPLTGTQIRRAISDAPDMLLSFNAIIEHRAHHFMEEAAKLAKQCADAGDVAGMKVAIDTYMKLAAKIAPGLYGDKATLELVGAGGGPVKHTVEMSPEDAYKAMLGGVK